MPNTDVTQISSEDTSDIEKMLNTDVTPISNSGISGIEKIGHLHEMSRRYVVKNVGDKQYLTDEEKRICNLYLGTKTHDITTEVI